MHFFCMYWLYLVLYVKSVVEFEAVVWTSLFTQEHKGEIERIQKCAFAVILGYEAACAMLHNRKEKVSLKFAKESSEHPTNKHWFVLDTADTMTRSIPAKYKPVLVITWRFL